MHSLLGLCRRKYALLIQRTGTAPSEMNTYNVRSIHDPPAELQLDSCRKDHQSRRVQGTNEVGETM